jgi:hypothetical protein
VSATSIDTVGAVDSLVRRTGLDLQTSLDSIPFDARGISARYGTFTLYVTGPRTGKRDSILINPAGKVVYP